MKMRDLVGTRGLPGRTRYTTASLLLNDENVLIVAGWSDRGFSVSVYEDGNRALSSYDNAYVWRSVEAESEDLKRAFDILGKLRPEEEAEEEQPEETKKEEVHAEPATPAEPPPAPSNPGEIPNVTTP